MTGHSAPFTVRHTTRQRVRSGDETVYLEEIRLMRGYGRSAHDAVENAVSELASDDDRLDDLHLDDEYEAEFACAIDDVEGRFEVFDGAHDTIPEDLAPVHVDGELPDDLPVRRMVKLVAAG